MQDYTNSAGDFIPLVLKSVTSSMRRSYRASSSSSSSEGHGKVTLPAVYQHL